MIAKLCCAASHFRTPSSFFRFLLKRFGFCGLFLLAGIGTAFSAATIPAFAPPDGGWIYLFNGNAVSNGLSAALDGSWNHLNGSDAWSGDGRGAGVGLPGGVSTSNGVVTIEDAVSPGASGNDNRRIYFTRNISTDAGVTNANTLLNDGVTLSFRARLTPPSDPLIELTNAPNGFVNVNDGKGMFGIRQAGSGGMLISFSLNQATEDTALTTSFNFGAAGLHMNNLNGDVRSANVDPGEGGTINLLSLDPTAFHEFWITIQDNGANPGTHRVSIYIDGVLTPAVFNVTAGTGTEGPSTNYLAMGLPSSPQRGAVDVDFLSYKPGVIIPIAADVLPSIVLQPANTTVLEGETASFNVGVTGAPPFSFQWQRNGSPIANATNRSFTTLPTGTNDNLAQFVVVVSNVNGSVTSAPPAILNVTPDTVPPAVVSAGSLNGTTIGVCFSERVSAASAENIANYLVNAGAVTVSSATLRTSDGGQSVLLSVTGLSASPGTPFTITASNIKDLSSAANVGGGTANGIVLGLTNADIGVAGVDPVVAGSAFVCASNQMELLAGGSDIGGTSDAFHYVYQARTGDFDLAMRVARLDPADRLTKAALVAREGLTASARQVNIFATPASIALDGTGAGANLYQSEYRSVAGGAAVEWPGGAHIVGVPYPNAWMRLIRQGNTFVSYYGTNGVDWTQLGQVTDSYPTTIFVGAGASAHTNAIGRSTTAIFQEFAFAPAPQIVTQPQSQVVTNGDSPTFSVTAQGVGTLRYQWHLNGGDIAGATNRTLTIPGAGPANAGLYSVTVANSGGAIDTAGATLTVRLFDYGDAPDGYGTLRSNNGARHLVVPGIYLGAGVDVDLDGSPGPNADGDDLSGSNDEDGVRFLTALIAGQNAQIEVVASTNGVLNAWLDWNGNGSFADPGEQVFTNKALLAGTNVIDLIVPHAATPTQTFARFRFSTGGFLPFNGPAADGEVEDYMVTPQARADLAASFSVSANPVAVASNLTFVINVANLGPSMATGVSVSHQVQGSVIFGTINSSKGSCARVGDTVTCDVGSLAEGESMVAQVSVTPQSAGTIAAQLQAVAHETDPNSANNAASASVIVEVPPAFLTQPTSLSVTQGDNVVFTASAQGTDPLGYRWERNGTVLSGETNASLSITNAQLSQEADYAVRVTNRVGSIISAPAHLTVLAAPTINQQPQSGTNYAGRTVFLSVTATGSSPLGYQWFLNGTNALAGATNSNLTLSNAQKSQSGDYSVSVANAAGSVISAAAHVVIVEADFGDAPDSYGSTLASNGARHLLAPGVRLGTQVDFEPDGQPDSAASGDDLNGQADEDGVVFPGPIYVGQVALVKVVASTNGLLHAWLDMQANGTWLEAGDQIFTNIILLPGTNTLSFRIPASAAAGATFARFRFSSAANLTPLGEAPDGEVEDYRVTILPASDVALAIAPHPTAVQMGTDINYSLIISNIGPSVAHSVALTDVLPTNVSVLSESPGQGSCSLSSGIVTCLLGDVSVGARVTVDLLVRPLSPGSYTHTFSVQALETDPALGNNQASDVRVVQDPPIITGQPQSWAATNGDNVTLTVTASGSDLRYRWSRNGAAISGATNATLLLTNIQPAQAGTYVVAVSNLVGSVTSDPAQVSVFTALRITSQPKSVTVLPGVTVTFNVAVVGNQPISFQWFFNGQSILNATNASLSLTNVADAQIGEYVVRVNNSFSTIVSDPAVLTLYVPPRLTTSLHDQTNFAGSDLSLAVEVSGSAPFSYQWYRDGVALRDATNASIFMGNVQKTNSGFYLVVVTNIAGSVASFARVTVLEVDFGDAPDGGYPTTMAFNGARHVIVPGVRLGTRIDFEPDGQPSDDAMGDDITGNDEDGVTFSGLYLGQLATISVVASTNGYLDAWMDFDQNGAWVDFGEQIFASQRLVTGTNRVSFMVPANAMLGNTFARFRFSTMGGLAFDGMALDGEVEDYQVMIAPGIDLDVRKSDASDPVLLGATLLYTVTVTNHGPSTATAVVLQDSLPPQASLVSISASQGSCSQTGQLIVCQLGDLASETGAQFYVTVIPLATGVMTNTARADAVEHDGYSQNSAAVQTTAVILPGASFSNETRLDINDNGPAQIYPSTILVSGLTATVYKVTVTLSNLTHSFPDDLDILLVGPSGQSVMLMSDVGGSSLINNVQVTLDDDATLTFPDNSLFISQTYKPANYDDPNDPFPAPAPAPPYGSQLSVFRGTDPNGVWSLFAVDDHTDDAGFIANGWGLTISTMDPLADLAVQVVDSPHKVIVGSNLTYSVIVSNPSAGWSSGSLVRDALPANAQLVSASSDSGSCTNTGGEVVCSVGAIAPGGFGVVTVMVRPQQLGIVSNWASVTGNERDLHTNNNAKGIVSFSKLPIDLALSLGSTPDPVTFGSNLAYSYTVSNLGPNPASVVTFTDTLPPTTALSSTVASQGSCSVVNGVLSCDLGGIAVGGTASIAVTLTPQSIRRITNSATVFADEVDFRPADNSATVVNAIALLSNGAAPAVTVTTNGPATPYPSTIFVSGVTSAIYSAAVTLSNLQSSAPENLDVLLISPSGQKIILMSDAGGNFGLSGVTLKFAANASSFVSDAGPLLSGVFAPTNYILGNETFAAPAPAGPFPDQLGDLRDTDPNGPWSLFVSDRNPVHTGSSIQGWSLALSTLEPIADLRLSTFAQPDPVAVGSNFLVTVQVSNAGPATASSIVLSNRVSVDSPQVSLTVLQGNCATLDGALVCSLPELVAGGSAPVIFSVSASAPGTFNLSSSVTGQQRDLAPGNNAASRSVVIEPAPFIVTPPASLVVTNGDSVQFFVDAGGAAPLMYSWRRNGLSLAGQTNRILLLPSAGLVDIGAYSVQVSNRVGAVLSASASLTVKMRPVIGAIPAQATDEDTSLTLPVVVGDFETPASALQLTTHSSDQVLLPDGAISMGGTGSNRFLTLLPGTNQSGSVVIAIVATDGDGISASASFNLTVRPVNDPPTISAIPNQITDEDTPIGPISFTIADADGLSGLSVAASSSNTGVVANAGITLTGAGANRTVTISPAPDQSGVTTITLTVTDPEGASASSRFDITVNAVNDPSTLNAIPDLVVDEDSGAQTVPLSGITSGAANESQVLSLIVSNSNPALLTNLLVNYTSPASAGVLTFGTISNAFGNASITVMLSEDGSNMVQRAFQVTVNPINDRPTLSDIPSQTTSEDSLAGPLSFTIGDVETRAEDLLVFGSSSNPATVPPGNITFTGTGSNRFVSVQPATNATGQVTIGLTVRDTDGGETSNSFVLNITPVNDLPLISAITNQFTDEDVAKVVSFTVGDVETPAGSLIVTATNDGSALIASLVVAGTGTDRTLTIVPLANESGSSAITLTVLDSDGASATSTFQLTVRPVNDPPTLDALADVVIDEDAGPQAVSLSGITSGAPNEVQTLAVTASTSDATVTGIPAVTYNSPNNNGSLAFTPPANANGIAILSITVNDGSASNNLVTRAFRVTVNSVNDIPAISGIGDQIVDEDTVIGPLGFTVSDVDGFAGLTIDRLSSNSNVVDGAGIVISGTGNARAVTIVPATNQNGTAVITLIARDTQGASASTSFRVTFKPVKDPPNISAIPNQVIAEDTAVGPLTVVLGDAESPASSLILTARSSNQQLLADENIVLGGSGSNRTIRLLPATNQSGIATITMVVRDLDGLASTNSFTLTVNPVNDLPILGIIPDQSTEEDTPVSIPLGLADADSSPAALVLSAISSNQALTPNTNIVFTGTNLSRGMQITPATNQFGSSTITVTLSDGSDSVSRSFVLTVTPVNDPPTLDPLANLVIAEDAGLQSVLLTGISSGATNENQIITVTAVSSNPALVANPAVTYVSPSPGGSLSFTPAANAFGQSIVTVTVSDGVAQITRSFSVTVNPVNDAPTISAISNQTTAEDTPIAVALTIADPDAAPAQLIVTATSSNSALVAPTTMVVNGAGLNRTLLISPNADQSGTASITVWVSDGAASNSTSFTLTVNAVNDAPTLNSIGDLNLAISPGNQTVTLTGISSGAANETQTLAITVTSTNTTLIPIPTVTYTSPNATGTLTLRPPNNTTGRSLITVTVNDGQSTNSTFSQSFMVNIRATANANPTVTGLTNQTILEDTVAGPLAFTIGDSGTPATLLTVSGKSSNPLLVPDTNIVFGGSASNRTVMFTPLPNQFGTSVVTISITDTNFGSVSSNILLTVNAVNDAPTISPIATQTIAEDASAVPVGFSVNDIDTPLANLLVTAISSNPGLIPNTNIFIGGSGTNRSLLLTPLPNQFGSATITVSVSDGITNASTAFALTVTSVNDLPAIAAVPDQTVNEENSTFAIPVTIADTETPAGNLTLVATSSVPALVSSFTFGGSAGSRTLVISPATNQNGAATITLIVSDTDGGTNSTTFRFTVNAVNDAPTLDAIANVFIDQGAGLQTVNLAGIGSGAANENQTLAVTAISSNPLILPNPTINYASPGSGGTLTFVPAPGTNGTALISVTVNDGQLQNNLVTRSFTVTVNDRPFVSAIADQVVAQNAIIGPVAFTVADRDTAASNLVVRVTSSNQTLIPDGNIVVTASGPNRTMQITPGSNQVGSATILVTVTDSNNLAGLRSFVVVVTPILVLSPQITSQPQSQTVTNGALVILAVGATGDELTLQWRRDAVDLAGQTNSTLSIANVSPADSGSYDVRASNSAGAILSSNAVVRVLVSPVIIAVNRNDSGVAIRIPSAAGLNYFLEAADSLVNPVWQVVDSRSGTGNEITLLDSSSVVPQKFYRVRAQ